MKELRIRAKKINCKSGKEIIFLENIIINNIDHDNNSKYVDDISKAYSTGKFKKFYLVYLIIWKRNKM